MSYDHPESRHGTRRATPKPQPEPYAYAPVYQLQPAPAPASGRFDAKTIVALTGLLSVLLGGVEMRIQVGALGARLDRIESELRAPQTAPRAAVQP